MITENLGLSPRIAWLVECGRQCHIPASTAILGSGGIQGISALIGGGKQADALKQSAAFQQQRFEEVKQLLSPFVDYGKNIIPTMQALTGTTPGADPSAVLTAPLTKLPGTWEPTMENLEKMPGYQFQKTSALQAGTNALEAAGLFKSGAGATNMANIASNLAASNWQSNWQQWLGQQNLNLAGQAQTFNQLSGMLGTGLQAGAAVGGVGIQSAANVGNALAAAGASQGATAATVGQIGGNTLQNYANNAQLQTAMAKYFGADDQTGAAGGQYLSPYEYPPSYG